MRLSPARVILMAGGLPFLGAALLLAARRSGFGCGPLIAGRVSIPALAAALLMGAAGLLLWAAALRLDEARLRALLERLAPLAFGIGLALLLLEIMVRAAFPVERRTVENLRIAAHPVIGSWRPADSRYERFGHTFVTDGQGIVIRTPQGSTPPDGARRIMLLGDSFVEGQQVEPDENLSVQLEAALNAGQPGAAHVLNLGMSGFGPLRYLLVYRTFAPTYRPDVVIVMVFVGNDFSDDARLYHQDRILIGPDGAVAGLKPEVDLARREVWDARKGILHLERGDEPHLWPPRLPAVAAEQIAAPLCAALDAGSRGAGLPAEPEALRNVDAAIYRPLSAEDEQDVARTLGYLRTLHDEAAAAGAETIFVIIPEMTQVTGGDVVQATGRPQAILADFCAAGGYTCLDLLPIFSEHKDEGLYIVEDGHFSVRGHALAAEAIGALLSGQE